MDEVRLCLCLSLSLVFFFYIPALWSTRTAKSTSRQVLIFLLIIAWFRLLAGIEGSVCILKSLRDLCVLGHWHNGYSVRKRPRRSGFNPRSSYTKDSKMVRDFFFCLTASIISYGSRVKWSNPGKRVASFSTIWCSSNRKGSLWVTLDYSHQLLFS